VVSYRWLIDTDPASQQQCITKMHTILYMPEIDDRIGQSKYVKSKSNIVYENAYMENKTRKNEQYT